MSENNTDSYSDGTEQADRAEIADEKPKKSCEYAGGHGGECGETAVKAVWNRTDARTNDHGVWIATEVRPIWVCEDHTHVGDAVPDAEAEVLAHR